MSAYTCADPVPCQSHRAGTEGERQRGPEAWKGGWGGSQGPGQGSSQGLWQLCPEYNRPMAARRR